MWELNEWFPLAAIFVETRPLPPPSHTSHTFEELRDEYEREVLLEGFRGSLADITETKLVEAVNDPKGVQALRTLAPDVVLVFGTGKLLPQVTEVAFTACLNLHGGNPEHYRGLDTHLWAIYHRDFNNLVTTLHHVDAGLDTGDIVFQSQLKLSRDCNLHQLRAINTQVCTDLSLLALHALESIDSLPSRKQLSHGRYYSSMPAELKEVCVQRFKRYVARL